MSRETWDDIASDAESALAGLRSHLGLLGESLRETFFLPGEYAVALLIEHLPGVANQAGLDLAGNAQTWTIVVSGIAWLLFALVTVFAVRTAVRALVRAWCATRSTAAWTARSLAVRLSAPLLAWRRRRLARRFHSEEHRIDPLQMAVLDVQRKLPPGHVATAVDIAGELSVRPGLVQPVLDELKKLGLVQVAFATSDGYPGYTLTRPGEIFVATCGATARRAPPIVAGRLASQPIRIPRPATVPARHSRGTTTTRRPR